MAIKVGVHIEGLDAVKGKFAESCTKAEHLLAQQIAKDTSPFVPMSSGSLDQRTRVVGANIVYPGPYARFLYYGKVMVDPNTGSTYAPKGGHKVVTDRNLVFRKDVHENAQSHWFEASKALNLEKWERAAEKAIENGLNKKLLSE